MFLCSVVKISQVTQKNHRQAQTLSKACHEQDEFWTRLTTDANVYSEKTPLITSSAELMATDAHRKAIKRRKDLKTAICVVAECPKIIQEEVQNDTSVKCISQQARKTKNEDVTVNDENYSLSTVRKNKTEKTNEQKYAVDRNFQEAGTREGRQYHVH